MSRKIFALLVGLMLGFAEAGFAQELDATIRLGDKFTGTVLFGADVDVLRFEGAAGAQVSVTVTGKGKLKPIVRIQDAFSGQVLQSVGAAGSKAKLSKVSLPESALYDILIGSFNGKTGDYSVTTKVNYPASATAIKGSFPVQAGGVTALVFEAESGTTIGGTIKFPAGLQVQMDTALTPQGPADISPFVTVKPTKLKLQTVAVSELGSYALLIEGVSGLGSIDANLTITHPKPKKKTFKEIKESTAPGSIGGALQIADVLALPETEPNGTPSTATFLGLSFPGNSLRATGVTSDNGIPGGQFGDPLNSADLDSWRIQCNQSQTVTITLLHDVGVDFDLGVFDVVAGQFIGFLETTDEPEIGILDVVVPQGGQPALFDIVVFSFVGTDGYILSTLASSSSTALLSGAGDTADDNAVAVIGGAKAGVRLRPALPGRQVAGSPAGVDHFRELDAEFVAGEFVVELADPAADRAEFAARHGLSVRIASPAGPFVAQIADLSAQDGVGSRRETVRRLEAMRLSPEVRYVHLNYIHHAAAVPNDTFFNFQWHYPLIKLPQAWDLTKGSPNVVVAVIDTGVVNHPDLAGRFTNDGIDMISLPQISLDGNGIDLDPSDPGDQNLDFGKSTWHGTHVSGTVGAQTNNGSGVAGVDWFCRIMPIRVLGKGGGTDFDICEGIKYAARLANASGVLPATRANVMNLSLGGPNFSQSCQNAVLAAKAAGTVVVCAAGNDNVGSSFFPAAYNGSISVSAVDLNKQKAPYSNFGPTIDVAAPGGDVTVDKNSDNLVDGVLSTLVDEDANAFNFVAYQGTSMAAPHVAGVCALILSANPSLSPDQVEQILKTTAEDLGLTGPDTTFGAGLINALAAVQSASFAQTPQLALSTSALDFGTAQNQLSIGIQNAGGGTLSWSATDAEQSGGNWLTLGSAGGSAPTNLQVNVNRGALVPGSYFGTVSITSNGGNANVAVKMDVSVGGGAPLLQLSTTSLNFGGSTTTLPLVVQNAGGGTLSFTAQDSEVSGGNWLTLSATQGNIGAGQSQTINVTVNRAGLAPGSYSGSISINSNGGNALVGVSMNVPTGGQPILSLSTNTLHFGSQVTSLPVSIVNVGGGTLNYSTTDVELSGGNWLSESPSAGTAPATLNVLVNRGGLVPGSYSGTVTVASNGGSQVIAVTMEVVGKTPVPLNLGPVFVLAVDPISLASKAQGSATQASPLYQLNQVPVGVWLIVAGPDLDGDNFICGVGEPCGVFPVTSDPTLILVKGGAMVTGADFAVNPDLLLPTLFGGGGFQPPAGGFRLPMQP